MPHKCAGRRAQAFGGANCMARLPKESLVSISDFQGPAEMPCVPFKPHKHSAVRHVALAVLLREREQRSTRRLGVRNPHSLCTCLDLDFWHLQVQQGEQAQRRV